MEFYLALVHHFTSEGYPSSFILMKFDTNCPKVCMPIAMLHVWNFTKLLLKALMLRKPALSYQRHFQPPTSLPSGLKPSPALKLESTTFSTLSYSSGKECSRS